MIEAMKQMVEAFEIAANGGGVDFYAYAKAGRQAIAEAEKHEVSQEPVQVTIKDFVKAVEGKEDMVGCPVYWAQWPNADTHPQPKREQDGDCQQCGGKGCVACDAREQEPVAWADHGVVNWIADKQFKHASLLYTHPPQPAKPIPCANHCEATAFEIVIKNLQGEIERLKASQRTEQEPVAWMVWGENNVPALTFTKPADKYVFDALYTPSQRTWVDLTDEDIRLVRHSFPLGGINDFHSFAKAVLAKSKEKNHGV